MMMVRSACNFNTKFLILNTPNLRMIEVFSQYVAPILLRQRMLIRPCSGKKTLKDSDFEGTSEEEPSEYSEEVLSEQLDNKISELESNANFTRKIMIKKSIVKKQKQPNMLTYCEREYMKALHRSNPDEWTPEILSESFPALPNAIRIILKSKWKPESQEKVILMNKTVLDNWEKLKRNELKVSPELHKHLKNFINKSDVLKLQINNPNFSFLPAKKSIFNYENGFFSSLIKDYEEELNSITKGEIKPKLTAKSDSKNLHLKDSNTTELKTFKQKTAIIPEYSEFRTKGKLVTLSELKKSIFRKMEREGSFLSEAEEEIIQKTLTKHHLFPVAPIANEITIKSEEVNENAPSKSAEIKPSERYEGVEETKNVSHRKMKLRKASEFFEEEEKSSSVPYSNLYVPTQLNDILIRKKSQPPPSEEKVQISQKIKIPVAYYGTQKDEELFKKLEEDISSTSFWNSENNNESFYENLHDKQNENSFGKLYHHQKYAYPEKIKIPKSRIKKGELYKFNDCYYDDKGNFLYRVPGMT